MSGLRTPPLGSLRQRVELWSNVQNIDSAGGHRDGFVLLATVWARVRAGGVAPGVLGDGRGVQVTHTITIRFRSDLGGGDRIVFGERTFEVLDASDLNGRRAYLVCRCLEANQTG